MLFKNKKIKIIKTIYFIFFLFSFNNAYSNNPQIFYKKSYCEGSSPENFISNKIPDNITIETKNPKKWSTSLFKLFLDLNSPKYKTNNTGWYTFQIKEEYKKKHKANIKYRFQNLDYDCKAKAKVSIRGDLWWHLDWRNGYPFSSLKIDLEDSHINNITKFNLLIPKAKVGFRKNINLEIFITSLLNKMNLLAPKTYFIKANINGNDYNDYLFQERLEKEFLESRGLVEGPILEGDTRFTSDIHSQWRGDLALTRLMNSDYAKINKSNALISMYAVSYLNNVFIDSGRQQIRCEKELFTLNKNYLFEPYEKYINQLYEAMIIATQSEHSLTCDDRKFYFDPINKILLPIYNDGKSTLDLDNDDEVYYLIRAKNVTYNSIDGSKVAIDLIEKIDDEKFFLELQENGFKLSFKDYQKLKNKVILNLNALNKIKIENKKLDFETNYFNNIPTGYLKKKIKLVFFDVNNNILEICNFNLEVCKKESVKDNLNFYKNLVSQDFLSSNQKKIFDDKNYYIFLSINKEYRNILELRNKTKEFRNILIDSNFSVEFNETAKTHIDKEKKEINIDLLDNDARVKVSGTLVDGWSFTINGENFYKKNIDKLNIVKKNFNMLTGCLSFIGLELKNVKIKSNYSLCEDSVNFIKTKGTIKNVEILNSISDGLDFDFSEIEINTLLIKNAKNDCLDMSFGKYIIDTANIETCGDKGVSLGEKSRLLMNMINISDSYIGVASKDSSLANIYSGNISSEVCLAAYRKKQEFSGGTILYKKNINCVKKNNITQEGSKTQSY